MRSALCGILGLSLAFVGPPIAAQQLSAGCGHPPVENGLYTADDNGIARPYRLRVPPDYNPTIPTPVIFAFHGWGGDEDSFLGWRAVRRSVDRMGYIVVAPRGLGGEESDRSYASWTFPGSATGLDGDGVNSAVPTDTALTCDPDAIEDFSYPSCGPVGTGTAKNICSWTQCQTDDVAFIAQLITDIGSKLCVDENRIFAVGGSNGGMFVWGLGQDARTASSFRAVSALIGLPHRGYSRAPARQDGLPMLLITGIEDATVPPGDWESNRFTTSFDSAPYFYDSATTATRAWAEAKSCTITAPARSFEVGSNAFDCRSYCEAEQVSSFPAVMDCRMQSDHEQNLRRTWPLIMDFFQSQ